MMQGRACQHSNIQEGAIDTITACANDWCITINKEKSCTTLFTLSTKASIIKISGTPLKEKVEANFGQRQT